MENGFAASGGNERLPNRDIVGTQGHDRSAATAPTRVVRVRDQQHERQSGPIQVLQERIAQAMQGPGDNDRVHLA